MWKRPPAGMVTTSMDLKKDYSDIYILTYITYFIALLSMAYNLLASNNINSFLSALIKNKQILLIVWI